MEKLMNGMFVVPLFLCSQTVLTWGYIDATGRRGNEAPPAAVRGIPAGQTITKVSSLVNPVRLYVSYLYVLICHKM